MSLAAGHASLWLLQAAVSRDTLLMKQVGNEQGWFEQLTGIASGLMTVSLLVLTVFLVPAAWNFRKSHKRVNDLLDRVYGDINPIVRHASTIADNVDYITTSIRVDVQQVNETIAMANQRLLKAVEATEKRLRDVNALIDVAQREAEDMFVATASTLRGVRTGAAELTERNGRRRRLVRGEAHDPLMEEELDELEELQAEAEALLDPADELYDDEALDDLAALGAADAGSSPGGPRRSPAVSPATPGSREGVTIDGDDRGSDGEGTEPPGGGPERPRIRPRRRARRRSG